MAGVEKTVKKAVKNSVKKAAKKAVKKELNLSTQMRYEKFCVEYRKNGGNGTLAAIAAGYSERTAEQQASRLLRNVKVIERLEEMSRDAIRKQIIVADKRAAILSEMALDSELDPNARIRAIDVLNKMDGLYVIKTEVKLVGSLSAKLQARKNKGATK